jgi:hypothetical protein
MNSMCKILSGFYFVILLSCYSLVFASKTTIDADGGASYTSWDAVITAIQGGSDWDTVEFVGSDQDSYTWTAYCEKSIGTIYIRSTQTNPDLFPIINHTTTDASGDWQFFNNVSAYFENVIFTGTKYLNLGQDRTHSFNRCIFKDFTSTKVVEPTGTTGSITFQNCLFEGNTATKIFSFTYSSGTPTFKVTNCTFDNNTSLFGGDDFSYFLTNFAFTNCIFSNNTSTFDGNNFRSKTTYSLTSEAITYYGTGCVSNSNPSYVSSSRANPTDWKISSSSPAKNIGTTTGAPTIDIGAISRASPYDAGCWEANSDYTWDISTSSGIQAGSGTWGTNSYWTATGGAGTSLTSWSGGNATFAGSDGTYTITISGTQNVDSITFSNSGYTLSGGTAVNLGTEQGIYVASGESATISTPITTTGGVTLTGGGYGRGDGGALS